MVIMGGVVRPRIRIRTVVTEMQVRMNLMMWMLMAILVMWMLINSADIYIVVSD